MKVALVHDYIKEFGGAERVLKVLTEMYPEAPIYTAFTVKSSTAGKLFRDKIIHESWLAPILRVGNLFSPLRFLIPLIWGSFDLRNYDLVISSASWYITRGFKTGKNTKVVVYCHTPPRWLYGYETSVGFTKYLPVKIYAAVVGHFLRIYDWNVSQKVDNWIVNSKNIQDRVWKFYRKRSVVVYPPVDVLKIITETKKHTKTKTPKNKRYFLIVSRQVGGKGIEDAVKAFRDTQLLKYDLKIVGETAGYSEVGLEVRKNKSENIKYLGRVNDRELYKLYAGADGFIALARDEDFGMTVVEAQAAGTPVVAYNGGGYKETVIDGKTGVLINDVDEKTVVEGIKRFEKIKWDRKYILKNVQRFSKERFLNEFSLYTKK